MQKKIILLLALIAGVALMVLYPTGQKGEAAVGKNKEILLYTDKSAYSFGDGVLVTLENKGNSTLYLGGLCGELSLEYMNGSSWVEYTGMPDGIAYMDKFGEQLNITCSQAPTGEMVVRSFIKPGEVVTYQVETMEGPMYVVPLGTFKARVLAYSGCMSFRAGEDGLLYAACVANETLYSNEFRVLNMTGAYGGH